MDIIQWYYTLPNKNNGAELMFLFNIGLSRLINMLFLISDKNLSVPWARMVESSNEGSWLQNKRRSRIELSAKGLTFVKVNGEYRCALLTFLSCACQFHHDRKHTEIYTQHRTKGRKIFKTIFKTENIQEISLILQNYLDFTTT